MAPASIDDLQSSATLRVSFLIVCASMLTACVGSTEVSMTAHNASFQNGIVGPPTVTILTDNEDRKCQHCRPSEKDNDEFDKVDDDNDRYQDGDGDVDNDDDDDLNENGVDLVDQRQNGTENYRIRVSGLLLIITPPELPMPTPSNTETPPLTPPPPPSNSTDGTLSLSGIKRRFNERRNGQKINEQHKRKLSKYQARIPQFITALLRNRRIAQQHNH